MQAFSGQQHLASALRGHTRLRSSRFVRTSELRRLHVAAVCYRLREGELEFLLVRTRNGHWTFPKGGVDQDPTTADAAAREAYEEAGVIGSVERVPFISYRHCKPSSRRRVVVVQAHLCRVKQLVPPPEQYRDPTWLSASKAKRRLQKYRSAEFALELAGVIDRAAQRIMSA
jgi:8-oxo-dGTP pyrophosphatase MutT (NUDIX family)